MADVLATSATVQAFPYPITVITWGPLTAANPVGIGFGAGQDLITGAYADRSIQIKGTPDSATLVVQGSNDGTNWFTLHEPDGTALSFTTDITAGVLKQIAELTVYTQITTSGGGGSQSITAVMCCRTGRV